MDCNEIRKTFDLFKDGKDLVEIRCFRGKKIYSGYFIDADTLIREVERYDDCAVYFTLNEIKYACASRSQRDNIRDNCKCTTSDGDVERRKWVLIDFDPKRPADTNSTDEEKAVAKSLAKKVYLYLIDRGFPKPIFCDSGNGWHLLYRCDLLNTEESKQLISSFLQSLAVQFYDGLTDIDTAVFNASRICKLYGTFSRKGADTEDRPQRISRIHQIPPVIEITHEDLFRKVANELPSKPQPTFRNGYAKGNFDIDDFLARNRIEVAKEIPFGSGGRKLVLKECPFDSNHKAPDAAVFVMPDGAYGFKCFHNSCSQYTWSDLREKFEPRSRDDMRTTVQPVANTQPEQEQPKGKEWMGIDEIANFDRNKIISIPSGFEGLDDLLIGFNKREVTVWSGSNASGKSSLLNTIMLNAAQKGYVSAIWSGELPAYKLKNWLMLACAGKNYTERSKLSKTANAFYIPDDNVKAAIIRWMSGKIWVYNNDFTNRYDMILESVRKFIHSTNVDVVVIDNLMALDIGGGQNNLTKLEQQKRFILDVVALAKELNIHIHIVCHPRKSVGFLRKTDISGTSDLTNAVDNVMIVHRVNKDFERGIKEFYGDAVYHAYSHYGNVVEVCKNRDLGVADALIGLFYEVESKRFLGSEHEDSMKYDWRDGARDIFGKEGGYMDDFEIEGDLPL